MSGKLAFNENGLRQISSLLSSRDNPVIDNFFKVVEKYGTPEEINQKAATAARLETKMARLKELNSPYLKDIEWLIDQKNKGAFISIDAYRQNILKGSYDVTRFNKEYSVILEISALQYFPWFVTQAKKAIRNQEIMPGRYIRVRRMKESEHDQGDLIAISAAMEIIGASWVETLDTKGADGSNVHLGGPETITGYFGGVGQPNDYALKWIDEYLYYYTKYGVRQVLNLNPGTILLGYMLHNLGVDIEFKISVFMGNDNPYSVLWTLLTAKMFSRADGTTPLAGFNFSNSINNKSIELCSRIRHELTLDDVVRFEHHITETYKSIVRQPYDRLEELVEIAPKVKNIAAKHEGGITEVEKGRKHPSDILDYFMAKEDVLKAGIMADMEQNYLDKHDAVNRSARELTKNGIPFVAAPNLHRGTL
ncbi:MAG: hypothetical protein HQK54_12575 [Oligoflexales bacterium]|nr:hypothetical protein [Oligoflexales bacterium]